MQRLFTPEKKKVVFFDMNDTLVTRKDSFRHSFLTCVREFTARLSDAPDASPEGIWRRYEAALRRSALRPGQSRARSPAERRRACLRAALEPLSLPVTSAFADTFFERVLQLRPLSAQQKPGVSDALTSLAKHYRLGVISNGSADTARAVLRRLGLDAHIPDEHVFASVRRAHKKPNAAIFRRALDGMGVSAAQAVMVGNSWRHDIYGATRVGMDAVWITGRHAKAAHRKVGRERVVTIRHMKQLKSLFLE